MARVAEKLADVIYLTSDNPRTENPQDIIDQVITGFSPDAQITGAGRKLRGKTKSIGIAKPVIVEADRRIAIERILADAQAGDIVCLAGKGHEDYQILGAEKRHFDDVEEATRVLSSRQWAAANDPLPLVANPPPDHTPPVLRPTGTDGR